MSVEEKETLVKAVTKRWIILALLSIDGIFVGIMTVLSGTISNLLIAEFDLKVAELDWIFIANAGSALVFSIPIGLLARVYPQEVKKWLLLSLLFLSFSYAFMAVSMLDVRMFFCAYIAQIFCGIDFPIFVVLLGISSVSWFAECEQATVFGVAYGSLSVGNLLGAVIPAVILSAAISQNIIFISHVIKIMYACISMILVILIVLACAFIPNSPATPPSNLENARRLALRTSRSASKVGLKLATRQYWNEMKDLVMDWQSLALLLSYSISMTVLLLYFLMLPIVQTHPPTTTDSNPLKLSAKKTYYLSYFAGGGAIASVVSGVLLDKIKSYRPLAYGLGLCNVIFAVIQCIVYIKHSEFGLYLSVGFQGTTIISLISFTSEILKQNIYPRVSEETQGIVVSALSDIVFVSSVYIFRSCTSAFGDFSFYIIIVICCLMQALLLLCINPSLNRFHSENQRLLPSSPEED